MSSYHVVLLLCLSQQFFTCQGFPYSVFFIVSNEFCERFSYYGMRGKQLVNRPLLWSISSPLFSNSGTLLDVLPRLQRGHIHSTLPHLHCTVLCHSVTRSHHCWQFSRKIQVSCDIHYTAVLYVTGYNTTIWVVVLSQWHLLLSYIMNSQPLSSITTIPVSLW